MSLSRIGLVLLSSLALASSSGCVTTAATKTGFSRSWHWASVDQLDVDFAPPWSEKLTSLSETRDRAITLDGTFSGVRLAAGSRDETLTLDDAHESGALRDADEVLGCYAVTKDWKLPEGEAFATGLILARDDEAPFVLAREPRGWVRCRASDLRTNHGSVLKEIGVIAGWIPLWVGLVAVDTVLVGTVVGLVLL
jgi:hypothetical protein